MRKKWNRRFGVCCLILALALPHAACGGATAATMRLLRTEGSVAVENPEGSAITVTENMGLYSGYLLGTEDASYAWIDLDKAKLAKLDEASEIGIEKKGKDLTIRLHDGSIFFHVTEPLAEDETMQIRTSDMVAGIRGTCGWVSDVGGTVTVGLLEGRVECASAAGETVTVEAGWKATLTADGEMRLNPLTKEDIPGFIRGEADSLLDEALRIGEETAKEQDYGNSGEDGEDGEDAGDQMGSDPYALPPELDDGIERTVIEAATWQEVTALRNRDLSNTEIHLTADLYELGDSVFSVQNAVNLRIIGGPSTRISGGKNGGDCILFAGNCENLQIYRLKLGNDTDGEMSECLSLYKCSGVQIDSCVFYSGMYGLHGDASDAVVSGSEVFGCGEGGLYWRQGSLTLQNCSFSDNGQDSAYYNNSPMFQLTEASLQMTDCSLYRNACVNYVGSDFKSDGQGGRVWVSDGSPVTETGTVSEENAWAAD